MIFALCWNTLQTLCFERPRTILNYKFLIVLSQFTITIVLCSIVIFSPQNNSKNRGTKDSCSTERKYTSSLCLKSTSQYKALLQFVELLIGILECVLAAIRLHKSLFSYQITEKFRNICYYYNYDVNKEGIYVVI